MALTTSLLSVSFFFLQLQPFVRELHLEPNQKNLIAIQGPPTDH